MPTAIQPNNIYQETAASKPFKTEKRIELAIQILKTLGIIITLTAVGAMAAACCMKSVRPAALCLTVSGFALMALGMDLALLAETPRAKAALQPEIDESFKQILRAEEGQLTPNKRAFFQKYGKLCKELNFEGLHKFQDNVTFLQDFVNQPERFWGVRNFINVYLHYEKTPPKLAVRSHDYLEECLRRLIKLERLAKNQYERHDNEAYVATLKQIQSEIDALEFPLCNNQMALAIQDAQDIIKACPNAHVAKNELLGIEERVIKDVATSVRISYAQLFRKLFSPFRESQ